MPYITQDKRKELDEHIEKLATALRHQFACSAKLPHKNIVDPGVLNYAITKLLLSLNHEGNYSNYNAIVGMLECCKFEFYRRAIAPYEQEKAEANGDVY